MVAVTNAGLINVSTLSRSAVPVPVSPSPRSLYFSLGCQAWLCFRSRSKTYKLKKQKNGPQSCSSAPARVCYSTPMCHP